MTIVLAEIGLTMDVRKASALKERGMPGAVTLARRPVPVSRGLKKLQAPKRDA
jgi:hypothetical protein